MFKKSEAQAVSENIKWIRPVNEKSPAVWGIHNGIVFGLWPFDIESAEEKKEGGPRGLIRVGYEYKGHIDKINFIAVEPVVNGKMEFSEISPSRVDGKWGKMMWAGDIENPGRYYPAAISRGVITHPDLQHPDVEELAVYVFMEQFLNGAHPYLKISIRSDRPEELCFEIFNEENSAAMQRCALTATMGNYSRLRLLYLKDKIIRAGELYKGFDGIDFIEKEAYPANELLRDKNDDYIVPAETDESFASLASWPHQEAYYARWNWRYRPFFKLTQYWRKQKNQADASLQVRVNGRVKYWSGGSANKNDYIHIPGGVAFENFEMREKYYSGQKFYFGLSRKAPSEIVPQAAVLK
ncbi:hypothetical protein [Parafilimonas sp.]|uniref:hypothetical protein n=1 Tax=Parafilimonas sp. TaxID=1969739 RepID=UPI0039E288C5